MPRFSLLHRLKALKPALVLGGTTLTALLAAAPGAQAQPLPIPGGYSFAFNQNLGGNPPPAGTPAWLTAEITDNNSGGVLIDLIGNLQSPSEFIRTVGFNIAKTVTATNGDLPSGLWSCTSTDIGCAFTKIEQQFNALPKVNLDNGAQGFDLAIELPNATSENRFQLTDRAQFSISGLSPVDFTISNDPGSVVTGLFSAAKVQGTAPDGRGSTTIVDPPGTDAAPGPLPLLGAGVALGFSRRLRQRLGHRQTC